MGLDMYLNGERFFWLRLVHESRKPVVKAEILQLGYWRKHPNLHGYIVQTFADGLDECQRIPLDEERLRQIMDAVKAGNLRHTTGFFFGESEGTDDERSLDLATLRAALDWLLAKEEEGIWRSVYYQASW